MTGRRLLLWSRIGAYSGSESAGLRGFGARPDVRGARVAALGPPEVVWKRGKVWMRFSKGRERERERRCRRG